MARAVEDALTAGGKLAVEGVLLIAEHGNYPRNDKGQILYPRLELMEQIVDVFRKTGQSVPVFNDKHLSYTCERAKKMLAWSRELKFPLMAGSSLPVTWRRPELELALESPIEDALVAGYGPIEVYGFHALETLQVMVERRKGGESGVKAVTCLTGKDVWKAGDDGTVELGPARGGPGPQRDGQPRRHPQQRRQHERLQLPADARHGLPHRVPRRHARHGAAAQRPRSRLHLRGQGRGEAKPASCLFHLPPPPGARFFDAQVANIEKLLRDRQGAVSGRAHAADHRHPRRRDGEPSPRGRALETPNWTFATPPRPTAVSCAETSPTSRQVRAAQRSAAE